jgi:hypothetical protein
VTLRARWVTLRAWFCDVCRHGAAGNTNFSTARMRRPGGMEHIEAAIASLQRRHTVHMAEYGGGARFRRSDPRNTLDVRLPKESRGGRCKSCESQRVCLCWHGATENGS